MNKKFAIIMSVLPISSSCRGSLYRVFCHKKIGKGFKIGFGSYIDSREILVDKNVCIGNLVRIKQLDRFELGENSSIGSSTVICGAYEINKFAEREFVCGRNVGILCSHYFDVVSPIIIGDYVTIAGKWTQFYTHSFDLAPNRLDGGIHIGNHVYIGAASLINLGVNICDNVVIQGGCCVNKDINEPGVYASQKIYKRGEVRDYADLFSELPSKVLETDIRVFSVEDNSHDQ